MTETRHDDWAEMLIAFNGFNAGHFVFMIIIISERPIQENGAK